MRGQFNFVTGSYQAMAADQGRTLALRLSDTASVQIIFDHVELTASAIPEPAPIACGSEWRRWESQSGEADGGSG